MHVGLVLNVEGGPSRYKPVDNAVGHVGYRASGWVGREFRAETIGSSATVYVEPLIRPKDAEKPTK